MVLLRERMKITVTETETITTDFRPERDAKGCPCPGCNGYADEAEGQDSLFTKDEIDGPMNCGRSYACCICAFKCRVCGKRILAMAEAPECD